MGDLIVRQAKGLDMSNSKNFVVGGRPLKFTPEEFEERVTAFFQFCEDEKKPLTLGRLACFLNCDSDTVVNYSHRDEFFGTIKKLRQQIVAEKGENLISGKGSTIGLIFDLKNNHGWKDQQEITVKNTDLVQVNISEDKEMIDVTPKKKQLRGDKVIEDK